MNGGAVIAKARHRAGLTQRVVADRLRTTTSVLSRWEHGKVEPSFATVDRVVETCGLSLASLLAEPEPDPHDLALLETTLALDHSGRLQRLIDFVAFVNAVRP